MSLGIAKPKSESTTPTARKRATKAPTHENNEIEKIDSLNWAVEKMSLAQVGERQTYLNHTSYFMGDKRVARDEAHRLVEIAIARGLPEAEAERTFTRSYEDGLAEEEIPPLSAITKEFNTKTSTSLKDDPLDNEFYGHYSLSYNFWKAYRNKLLFWESNSTWYQYNDASGAWEIVGDDELRGLLKNFLENLVLEIRTNNVKIPTSIYREQTKLWQKATLEAVMVIARSDFLVKNDRLFDQHPYLVNCRNGVVDLESNATTGEVRETKPKATFLMGIQLLGED